MNPSALAYYTQHDLFTNPGTQTELLHTYPQPMEELHRAINGTILHIWKVNKFFPELKTAYTDDVFTRRMEPLLTKIHQLEAQPLSVERPESRRAIVDCRNFAVLLCSVLRERGIPARPRNGFATYLEDTHYQDHWICEYWNAEESRWVMEDPDLKMHDLSPEQFITGVKAWEMSRHDISMATLFGHGPRIRGMLYVLQDMLRDFAALNGFVASSGDKWGIGAKTVPKLTEEDRELLDIAARLSPSDTDFEERQRLYKEREGLQPLETIQHFDYVKVHRWRTLKWMETL